MSMHIEYVTLSPTSRVEVAYDEYASNPLEDWSHGITFKEINKDRDYSGLETMSDGIAIDMACGLDYWREWYAEEYTAGYGYAPAQTVPTLRNYLDLNAAAWGVVGRNGYDGTLSFTDGMEATDHEMRDCEAIAYVSRTQYRQWHLIPDNKRMPNGYRERALESIRGGLEEYNKFATGDVYVLTLESHNPDCPYCEDSSEPDNNCRCWDSTDSIGGIIGSEYIAEAISNYFPTEQDNQS